jgi:hypothetical protein
MIKFLNCLWICFTFLLKKLLTVNFRQFYFPIKVALVMVKMKGQVSRKHFFLAHWYSCANNFISLWNGLFNELNAATLPFFHQLKQAYFELFKDFWLRLYCLDCPTAKFSMISLKFHLIIFDEQLYYGWVIIGTKVQLLYCFIWWVLLSSNWAEHKRYHLVMSLSTIFIFILLLISYYFID